MRASEALQQHKDEVSALFKAAEQEGIVNVRLIGSVSRGEDTDESDVDFLVSTPIKGKMIKVLGLGVKLERILGRKVDILIEECLPVYLRYLIKRAVKYE
ncbi:MAG: nucleotidyltransferase domain-containing protein [Succinivibrio sp.]|nr:nucleotidyltransferase domain-containing protein [Succinivibrio sp.]